MVQSQPTPFCPIHFGGLGQKQLFLIHATVLAHSLQLSNWTVKMIHWKALWLNTSTNWQDSLRGSGTTDALLIVWLKKLIKNNSALQKITNIENVITIIPCNAAFSEVLCTPQFYGNSKLIAFRSSPYQIFIALDVRLLLWSFLWIPFKEANPPPS